MQAILDRCTGDENSRVVVAKIIASRPDIGALDRAAKHGVSASVLPGEGDTAAWLTGELRAADAELVVLAGWMKLVPETVVREYRGRMINIHPALLPAFGGQGMYGRRVHEAVVRSGARVSGATVHFVDEIYDHGEIIAQWPVPVLDDDDPERLAARVLAVEHRLLPTVVNAFADGAFRLGEEGRVLWTRPWFRAETFTMDRGLIPR